MQARMRIWIALMLSALCAQSAFASDGICGQASPKSKAKMAVQIACAEHRLWREPFINEQGQLITIGPMEAERDQLADGTPAWQRVLHYWQSSVGVQDLFRHSAVPKYADPSLNNAVTRTQIIDTPWSGAFISYVMKQAGMSEEEFHFADGHIRYIKPAFAQIFEPDRIDATDTHHAPYIWRPQNPYTTSLQTGDLLCYVRDDKRVLGVQGFWDWMGVHYKDEVSLKTHCDIVVGVQQTHKQKIAYMVGGNVVQSVTMRALRLTGRGALSAQHQLPNASEQEAQKLANKNCNSNTSKACSSRQDWVVLLRAPDLVALDEVL